MTNLQIYFYIGVPFESMVILAACAVQMVATHNLMNEGPLIPTAFHAFWRDYSAAWRDVRNVVLGRPIAESSLRAEVRAVREETRKLRDYLRRVQTIKR